MEIKCGEGFVQLTTLTGELIDGFVLENLLIHFADIVDGLLSFLEHVLTLAILFLLYQITLNSQHLYRKRVTGTIFHSGNLQYRYISILPRSLSSQ
jgi:hypothetical protein